MIKNITNHHRKQINTTVKVKKQTVTLYAVAWRF